jgi:hypothetical protein
MLVNLSRLFAVLFLGCVAACGSPGAIDICNAACDAQEGCNYFNVQMDGNCRAACTSNQSTLSNDDNALGNQCQNAGNLRTYQLSCVQNATCGLSLSAFQSTLTDCGATYDSTTGAFDVTNVVATGIITSKTCIANQP